MSAIAEAFKTQINATSGVTALIGQNLYPAYVKIADKSYPLAVYDIHATSTIQTYGNEFNNLRSCQIVIGCIGATYASADAVKEQVLQAFDGFAGTWGTTVIQGCFLEEDGISEEVVTQADTEEILYYVQELTFLVWFVAGT